jgi:hypothetical protein
MSTFDDLFSELKPDVGSVANPLFDFSEGCLKKRDNFLPHGAVLTDQGELQLFGADPSTGSDITNSTEVLPVLHAGLRLKVRESAIRAIGVAENVTLHRRGQPPTEAIKVLFEHKRGLSVALYLPFEKQSQVGYVFGKLVIVSAKSEVNAWA